ncbi:MAG TPA: DsbA family protein [Bauldia sp.]|nr:DsbA family protein [Bauldia sp.]
MKLNSRALLGIAAVVVVIIAGAIWYFTSQQTTVALDATAANAATPNNASALMQPGPLGDMTLGDPKAPNVVIEYASMTCSHCQRFHAEVYPQLKSKYIDTGKAYFIFRDFPLDPLAAAAIVLAHCAPKERFFPLVDLMFDHQDQWAFVNDPETALFNLVKQAGFSRESFDACLTNQQLADGVTAVHDRAAKEFGVGSTPTFFVNGKMLAGEQTIETFDTLFKG